MERDWFVERCLLFPFSVLDSGCFSLFALGFAKKFRDGWGGIAWIDGWRAFDYDESLNCLSF